MVDFFKIFLLFFKARNMLNIKNKNITGYYAWKDDIENAGLGLISDPLTLEIAPLGESG